jgi:hypothetical protein
MNSFLRSRFYKATACVSTIVASILLTVTPATASILGARVRAAQIFNALSSDWYIRSHYNSGLLRVGQSAVIPTTLHAGRTYKIVAGGCEDAFDVDIAVFDSAGNLVARDSSTSTLAVADLRANWTGTVYIRVTMARVRPNSGAAAHYVVQYAYR